MFSILSLLTIVLLSILILRVATTALSLTGLSTETARFQARSAFTGAGFTTNESEGVVNHPVRRRIILQLMLLGNAGIVSAVSSLILTFVTPTESNSVVLKIALLVGGLLLMWLAVSSPWMDRHLSQWINKALVRYTELDVTDYASLMQLSGEYRIVELGIEPNDWLAKKTLAEARLRKEGIVVLGVRRKDGSYLGVPHGETKILPYDTLIAYGRIGSLERLDQRHKEAGAEWNHIEAVAEQAKVIASLPTE